MRIDSQRRNLLPIAQAEMLPALARIGRLINAITHREVRSTQSFTARDINDLGVGGRDGDRAYRLGGLPVEDRVPGAPVVVTLPDAAVDLPDIKDVRLAGNAGRRARSAAPKWPDHTPVQVGHEFQGSERRRLLGTQRWQSKDCKEAKSDGTKLH